ncbi:MAG: hypothetical protein DK306_001347, partial [Chloroflexi bacterium]
MSETDPPTPPPPDSRPQLSTLSKTYDP